MDWNDEHDDPNDQRTLLERLRPDPWEAEARRVERSSNLATRGEFAPFFIFLFIVFFVFSIGRLLF